MSAALRLAVLGDPLEFTRSPDLHRAGLAAVGLAGESSALRTPSAALASRLRELAAQGVTGVNLTHPLKERVLNHLDRVSDSARRARSVNTVGFGPSGWWGETTDGEGFLDWLRHLGRDPAAERVVIFGAGGAARSIALALAGAGAGEIVVAARAARLESNRGTWAQIPQARLEPQAGPVVEEAIERRASIIVNATPLADAAGPHGLERLRLSMLVLDLVYGAELSAWARAARVRGLQSDDGLGLLVFQARRSLALWTGLAIPLEPMMRAVGWPR